MLMRAAQLTIWVPGVLLEFIALEHRVLELVGSVEDDQSAHDKRRQRLPDGCWVCTKTEHV